MSIRLHVCDKYEVEYGFTLGVDRYVLLEWLEENGVDVCGADTDEWEISKHELEDIPPSAYKDLMGVYNGREYIEIDRGDLRELVWELINSKANEDYVYVHWF